MNGLDKYSEEYIEKEIGKNVDIPKDFGVPGPCEDQGKGKNRYIIRNVYFKKHENDSLISASQKLFSFAFVREPFQRFVSSYNWGYGPR